MSDTFNHEADAWDSLEHGDPASYRTPACRYCKSEAVYWREHYSMDGRSRWRLFDDKSNRLHDCRVKPDADAFDVVVE